MQQGVQHVVAWAKSSPRRTVTVFGATVIVLYMLLFEWRTPSGPASIRRGLDWSSVHRLPSTGPTSPNCDRSHDSEQPDTDREAPGSAQQLESGCGGHAKTPLDWKLANCIYLNLESQKLLGYRVSDLLPTNSYARNSVGYLYAIQHGATQIYEADDDNLLRTDLAPIANLSIDTIQYLQRQPLREPLLTFRATIDLAKSRPFSTPELPAKFLTSSSFTGFPLSEIGKAAPTLFTSERRGVYIQQGLANGDPDVDAILRLTRKDSGTSLNIEFDDTAPTISIPHGTFAPFNSQVCRVGRARLITPPQNTLWTQAAFWAMMLPMTTTSRVCDIWRAYWAQRLLWDISGTLKFMRPTVVQVIVSGVAVSAYEIAQSRSHHEDMKDFALELQLYNDALRLGQFLASWNSTLPHFFDRITDLSVQMAAQGFWGPADVNLTIAWLKDLLSVGYHMGDLSNLRAPSRQPLGTLTHRSPRQLNSSTLFGSCPAVSAHQAEAPPLKCPEPPPTRTPSGSKRRRQCLARNAHGVRRTPAPLRIRLHPPVRRALSHRTAQPRRTSPAPALPAGSRSSISRAVTLPSSRTSWCWCTSAGPTTKPVPRSTHSMATSSETWCSTATSPTGPIWNTASCTATHTTATTATTVWRTRCTGSPAIADTCSSMTTWYVRQARFGRRVGPHSCRDCPLLELAALRSRQDMDLRRQAECDRHGTRFQHIVDDPSWPHWSLKNGLARVREFWDLMDPDFKAQLAHNSSHPGRSGCSRASPTSSTCPPG